MSLAVPERLYDADDLERMAEGKHFELVDGRMIERGSGGWLSFVMMRLLCMIKSSNRSGWVFGAGVGYELIPGRLVRRPKISLVLSARTAGERIPSGYMVIAPDLVVEVVTDRESGDQAARRIEDFLRSGTRLIWVIHLEAQRMSIHRADGSTQKLGESDELEGEDVLPGFRCRVAELFAPPEVT